MILQSYPILLAGTILSQINNTDRLILEIMIIELQGKKCATGQFLIVELKTEYDKRDGVLWALKPLSALRLNS